MRHTAAVIVTILIPLLAAAPAAAVDFLKPADQVVDEVMTFLKSDVGNSGVRTNDGAPDGYEVPPYFYHYAIYDWNGLWSGGEGYPGYASVSFPAYTASVGIDAFLAYWRYTGDVKSLNRAVAYADWILDHLTPTDDLWANCPYSTQTNTVMGGGWDGEAIETDKPPMFGLRLLELYDVTGDVRYLDAADAIAATLVATQLDGAPEDAGRWPWRARPSDGLVSQDYTSHLTPAVRFLEAMATRTGSTAYADAAAAAWAWLLANPANPSSVHFERWEGFYEDQTPEMQEGKRDHYSAHETIVELIRRRPDDWQDTALAILDWVKTTYLIDGSGTEAGDYHPCTYEWTGWPHATFASSLQFAHTALLLHEALEGDARQDPDLVRLGLGMTAVATHGQNTRDDATDGRMFTTVKDIWSYLNSNSWYEQNFNTVKYLIAIMALDPSLAPDDEDHLLAWTVPVTAIEYGPGSMVTYATSKGEGEEVLKLIAAPDLVTAAGVALPPLAEDDGVSPGWFWSEDAQLLTVRHEDGPVTVARTPTSVAPPRTAARLGAPAPNPANPRVSFAADLDEAAEARVDIVDLRGRVVRTVHDGPLDAGETTLTWDGRDDAGRDAASGFYTVRLRSGSAVDVRGLTLAR